MPDTARKEYAHGLQGPDEPTREWSMGKALESLGRIERRQEHTAAVAGTANERLLAIELNQKHIGEVLGTRVQGLEKRMDSAEIRMATLEDRQAAAAIQDASRVGMWTGASWTWGVIVALGGAGLVLLGWIAAHLPFTLGPKP